ncbi:MAG: thioredoxin family protein [Catalinimonas sp.]
MTDVITPTLLDGALDYGAYRALVDKLLADGKATGEVQSEARVHYTKLNVSRMNRLDRTTKLTEELRGTLADLKEDYTILVLTEGWCGDAAQIVPVLEKVAEASPHLHLRLLLRDEHPGVMDLLLTNGARSIPKLAFVRDRGTQMLGDWGRPAEVLEMLRAFKASGDGDYAAFSERVHGWYARDRTQAIQRELSERIRTWTTV